VSTGARRGGSVTQDVVQIPPSLGVVVVCRNVENFVEQALDSIDLQIVDRVVVVDDDSEDSTPSAVQRFMRDCSEAEKCQFIENNERIGLGHSRNVGLASIDADYVLFLDGDDWFQQKIFCSIRDRLAEGQPDLVFFGHQRAWASGGTRASGDLDFFSKKVPAGIADIERLLNVFHVAWNKAYRRSFLLEQGIKFPDGIYEDIPWTYPLILRARTISMIDEVGINYRMRPRSITTSVSSAHFDAITQIRRLLYWLTSDPSQYSWAHATLYQKVKNQLLFVARGSRVPASLRRQFMREAGEVLDEWNAGLQVAPRLDLARLALRSGSRAILRLEPVASRFVASRFVRQIKKSRFVRQIKKSTRYLKSRTLRIVQKAIPVQQDKVFMESYWGESINCNPLAIARALTANGKWNVVWSIEPGTNAPVNFPGKTVKRSSLAMFIQAGGSRYLVTNTNLHTDILKKAGQVHIQTGHGTPLKTMGTDIRKHNPTAMDWDGFVKRSRRWDYVLSPNPHTTRVWRRSAPLDYKVIEIGHPRNDVLYRENDLSDAELKRRLGISETENVCLYAPTWVEPDMDRRPEFNPSEALEALGPGWRLVVRSHHLDSAFGTAETGGWIDASELPEIEPLLRITNLLITDFSSVMFDFAGLLRPIVIYAPHYEEYRFKRGFYFELDEVAPGPVLKDFWDLCGTLRTVNLSRQPSPDLVAFSRRFAMWDGEASSRNLVEMLFNRST